MKKFKPFLLALMILPCLLAFVACGGDNVIYSNNGSVDDWGPFGQSNNWMESKTVEGNKVLAIQGNSGYFPGEPEQNDGKGKWTSADYKDFEITYDIFPISSVLTGTTHTAQGQLDEGVVSVIFGLSGDAYPGCFAIFGAAEGDQVGLKFGQMDGGGSFTEGNYVKVQGDVWYTVTVNIKVVEGKFEISGSVVNKQTKVEVAKMQPLASTPYSENCYLSGCVYHGKPDSSRDLAYLDNITVVAHKN